MLHYSEHCNVHSRWPYIKSPNKMGPKKKIIMFAIQNFGHPFCCLILTFPHNLTKTGLVSDFLKKYFQFFFISVNSMFQFSSAINSN